MELSKNIEHLRSKAAALPRCPGVYIMQNEAGNVIYVGKSRSLRDRVSQYFHGEHDRKTERMAASVHDFRFITCTTEMEALALENSLIKQYTPKYNIRLKDAKSYPYIRIDIKSVWPRISMSRKRVPDGSLYFGPYSSTQTVLRVIAQLERSLGIPSCKKRFPDDIGTSRPCMYYQIGRCMGVCTGRVEQSAYREVIDRAADILRGGTREVITELTEKMNRAAEMLEFEEAARHRDAIEAMRKLGERQKAVGSPDVECDVIGLHLTSFEGEDVKFRDCATVFYIRSGYIADTEHFLFGNEEISGVSEADDEDSPLSAFLMALYQSREFIPSEILLSFELPEHDRLLLSDHLSERAEHRVTIRTPKRGASKYLCEMAVDDARTHSENSAKRDRSNERTLVSLASLLCLEVVPERIEAYDISNLGDEHITAGMVVAIDGQLKKSEYRTFGIRSTDGQDDYASMREAISRRLAHIGIEGDSMEACPDLILLDGGRGHVSVIRDLMRETGLDIPVFGMVKDEHHRTRTLTDDTGEVDITRRADVFRLIYGLQEEVHRYTVAHMTGAKRKSMKTSSLESIKGIGPAKSKALLEHFSTFAELKNASVAELSEAVGISQRDAEAIYEHFHKTTDQSSNQK